MGRIRYLIFGVLVLTSLRAGTQVGLVARPPAAPEYILGSGDEVVLRVLDVDEISDKPMRIDPNGFVDIPLAGRIHASGLTLEQLKAELASRLSKYMATPNISVGLTDTQSRTLSVIGSVYSPGVKQIPGPQSLIQVLSMAGGVKDDAGPRVILTRDGKWGKIPLSDASVDPTTGTSTGSVSLDNLLSSRSPMDNIIVLPNDIISIPKAEIVYVLGDVKKSGGFQLSTHPTISLLQALALAEGPDHDAKLSKAEIVRPMAGGDGQPKKIPVDIAKIIAGAPDIPLQGNDVLYVPGSEVKSGSRRAAEAILQAATGIAVYRF